MPATPTIRPLDLSAVWASPPPELDFVLPGLLAGTIGNVVASGGTGKTFLMLATAIGIAIGRDVGGIWGGDCRKGRAVFLSLEDPEPALKARLHAFLPELSEEERALAATSLEILPYAGHGFSLAKSGAGGPAATDWFGAFEAFLSAVPPRLCVIDTFNRALGGLPENDGAAVGWMIGQLEGLARRAGCAIVVCHHVSKQALMLSGVGEAHAARGSSVISDNARWQCNLWTPGAKEEGFAGISETERQSFVRLAMVKTNYGPPIAARLLRRGDGGLLSFDGSGPPRPPRKVASAARAGANGGARDGFRRPRPDAAPSSDMPSIAASAPAIRRGRLKDYRLA